MRLVAMPSGRIFPSEYRSFWPDYSLDRFQVLENRPPLSVRAAAPSSQEIPIVDEILLLPNLISWETKRKIVHARLLVHPLRGNYLNSWTKISKLLKKDRRVVKTWHGQGIQEIVDKIEPEKVCHISAFFEAAVSAYANKA